MTLPIFPTLDGLETESTRRIDYKTRVFESLSGKESRVRFRQYPKTSFKLNLSFLIENQDEAQLSTLMGFLMDCAGSYGAFHYSDPTDNTVTNHYCGFTDGLTFQLQRGINAAFEPVQNLNGVPDIYLDKVLQTSGYTLSDTGMITFAVDPGVRMVEWTGSYYYRCRFLQDGYDFNQLFTGLYECRELDFIGSVRALI